MIEKYCLRWDIWLWFGAHGYFFYKNLLHLYHSIITTATNKTTCTITTNTNEQVKNTDVRNIHQYNKQASCQKLFVICVLEYTSIKFKHVKIGLSFKYKTPMVAQQPVFTGLHQKLHPQGVPWFSAVTKQNQHPI